MDAIDGPLGLVVEAEVVTQHGLADAHLVVQQIRQTYPSMSEQRIPAVGRPAQRNSMRIAQRMHLHQVLIPTRRVCQVNNQVAVPSFRQILVNDVKGSSNSVSYYSISLVF